MTFIFWLNLQKYKLFFKGVVSRDWGRLQRVFWIDLKFFLLNMYFKFNLNFELEFFQNGVPSGALDFL
jgi:hypothetical protein